MYIQCNSVFQFTRNHRIYKKTVLGTLKSFLWKQLGIVESSYWSQVSCSEINNIDKKKTSHGHGSLTMRPVKGSFLNDD